MYCTDSGNQVLNYAYPEVSAVGCWTSDLHYLALIAGNDVCPAATEYLCHVFYCADAARYRAIVAPVGQGFDRTQEAV